MASSSNQDSVRADDAAVAAGFDQASHEQLRQLVATVRFQMDKQDAYEVAEVDNLINQVEERLAGEALPEAERRRLLTLLSAPRFKVAKRIGYAAAEVDALMTTLVTALS